MIMVNMIAIVMQISLRMHRDDLNKKKMQKTRMITALGSHGSA